MNGFNPFEKNKNLFDAIDYPTAEQFEGTFMEKNGRTTFGVWDLVGDGEYRSNVWNMNVTSELGDFVVAKEA